MKEEKEENNIQKTVKQNKKYQPNGESLDSRPIPKWFTNAKFGIFIHWGIYSVPAYRHLNEGLYASYAEWYYAHVMGDMKYGGNDFHVKNFGKDFEYRDFAPMFKSELFDPDSWADLFKRSGAQYVVLTSNFHDGFCLWPSSQVPIRKTGIAWILDQKEILLVILQSLFVTKV